MTKVIDIRELPARLAEALVLTASGGEVILTDGATPCARIVPLEWGSPRVAGLHAGAMQAAPDFDAPLPDEFWTGRT